MELLTDSIRQGFPALFSQQSRVAKERIVYARFFIPSSSWEWLAIEGETIREDFLFYGYVIGFRAEWEYFRLSELASVRIVDLSVQRDTTFMPVKFGDLHSRAT
ncbi:MAG: DUF2958 domain-containing protein [Chloracidobacterium sp.]|nr:DUF2958 domain-containing protein [Chloracidobacterium sp.]